MSNENNQSAVAMINDLLNVPTETALETRRTLLPPNTYFATVQDMEARLVTFKKDGVDVEKQTVEVTVTVEIPSELQIETGLTSLDLRKTVWLDTVVGPDGNLVLDRGKNKNLDLGKFLEAVGLNDGNNPIRAALGRRCVVEVTHEATKNGDLIERIKSLRSSGEY